MARVRIDDLCEADGAQILAGNRASRDHHRPFVSPCTDEDGFARWFAVASGEANRSFVARRFEDSALVGVINLSQIARGNFQSAYTGYHGYAETAGRGLMSEALTMVVDRAFGEMGLHRLEANIQPGNLRSIALVARVGFRKEGFSPRYLRIGDEWRDHERWAITVEDRKGQV